MTFRFYSVLVSIVLMSTLLSSPSLAQSSSASSQITDFKNMTVKQWQKLEAKFAEQRDKWESCEKQAKDQNIKGRRARWSFLYGCMTK